MCLAYTQQPGYIRRFMVHRTPFIHIEQMEKQTHFWRVLALDYSASMIHVPNRILLAYPKPTWALFMVSSWNLPSPPTPNVVRTFQKKKHLSSPLSKINNRRFLYTQKLFLNTKPKPKQNSKQKTIKKTQNNLLCLKSSQKTTSKKQKNLPLF